MSGAEFKSVDGVILPLTDEDRAYLAYLQTLPEPTPLTPQGRTYKADIWRRATPEEAGTIDAQIEAQPIRERNLFRDAQYLGHADPYFASLKAGFVAAFGQARADELLAPSVSTGA